MQPDADLRSTPQSTGRCSASIPTGVCVVTARAANAEPIAMVVGSFTSVSLNPPLVAFFPDRGSSSWAKLRGCEQFCVNILAANQEPVCRRLASKDPDKFAGVAHRVSARGQSGDRGRRRVDRVRAPLRHRRRATMRWSWGASSIWTSPARGCRCSSSRAAMAASAPASLGAEGQGLSLPQLRRGGPRPAGDGAPGGPDRRAVHRHPEARATTSWWARAPARRGGAEPRPWSASACRSRRPRARCSPPGSSAAKRSAGCDVEISAGVSWWRAPRSRPCVRAAIPSGC